MQDTDDGEGLRRWVDVDVRSVLAGSESQKSRSFLMRDEDHIRGLCAMFNVREIGWHTLHYCGIDDFHWLVMAEKPRDLPPGSLRPLVTTEITTFRVCMTRHLGTGCRALQAAVAASHLRRITLLRLWEAV